MAIKNLAPTLEQPELVSPKGKECMVIEYLLVPSTPMVWRSGAWAMQLGRTGVKFSLYHLIKEEQWACYVTAQSLRVLIYKMDGTVGLSSLDYCQD